jgi:PPK2 family polyphosphate:nucleotide phosphotransferase
MDKQIRKLSARCRVKPGEKFRIRDHDPADTGGLDFDKIQAAELLRTGIAELADLEGRLYAEHSWALLLIFQAMDAAGKDSTIKHVFSGLNPQSCQVHSFKVPSAEELDHDFLWRAEVRLPERGQIGIFNRSYYEEVLVVRVHPELLERQRLPKERVGKKIWEERFEDINAFEKHLWRNGTVVRKFFLNVSRDEQKKRFLERLDKPEKNWKFSLQDVQERERWDDYMEAYEEAIRATSTKRTPWYVVPADHKWYTHLIVADVIAETLEDMGVRYPKLGAAERRRLARARRMLAKS